MKKAWTFLLLLGSLAPHAFAAPNLDTPWTTLGLEEEATPEQVTAAYRGLVKTYHPDRRGPESRYFPYIVDAKDLLKDSEQTRIYVAFRKLVKDGHMRHLSWQVVRDMSRVERQRFTADVLQAEEAHRPPPVEDMLTLAHVLHGSVAEDELIQAQKTGVEAVSLEVRQWILEHERFNNRQLSRETKRLADDAMIWTDRIDLVVDGKLLQFADPFVRDLFRLRVRHALQRLVFDRAFEPLSRFVYYARDQKAYSYHQAEFYERIARDRESRLGALLYAYRASGWLHTTGSNEFRTAVEYPGAWMAAASVLVPYLRNRLAPSRERTSLIEYIESFRDQLHGREPFPGRDGVSNALNKAYALGQCAVFLTSAIAPIERLRDRFQPSEKKR